MVWFAFASKTSLRLSVNTGWGRSSPGSPCPAAPRSEPGHLGLEQGPPVRVAPGAGRVEGSLGQLAAGSAGAGRRVKSGGKQGAGGTSLENQSAQKKKGRTGGTPGGKFPQEKSI